MTKMPTKLVDAGAWLKGINDSWMYANLAKKIIREAPTAEVYGQWISMEERPPAVSDEYIVMIAGADNSTCLYYDAEEKMWFEEREGYTNVYKVTKWMPLPEAEEILQSDDDGEEQDASSVPGVENSGKNPNVCYCKGCGAEIVWMKMQSGRKMPCDAELIRGRLDKESKKTFVTPNGKVMRGVEAPDGVADFMAYRSHFETCPKAEDFKRK